MAECKHGIPATLLSDVEALIYTGNNPDCFLCPSMEWDEVLEEFYEPSSRRRVLCVGKTVTGQKGFHMEVNCNA